MRSPSRRLAHRIARERGWVNVDAMLRSLTVRQWIELEAFEQLEEEEPTGDKRRMDYRFAKVCEMLYIVNSTAKTPKKVLADFLLKFEACKPTVVEPVVTPAQNAERVGNLLNLLARARATPGEDV